MKTGLSLLAELGWYVSTSAKRATVLQKHGARISHTKMNYTERNMDFIHRFFKVFQIGMAKITFQRLRGIFLLFLE